ncbi:MAG: hypothetical protein MHMPM18_003956, partial [Marteilia pararefringens]
MKENFSPLDTLHCALDLHSSFVGRRINNIYDIDKRTLLFKINPPDSEGNRFIFFRSGSIIHKTRYDWPKNESPSVFCQKLRALIRNAP